MTMKSRPNKDVCSLAPQVGFFYINFFSNYCYFRFLSFYDNYDNEIAQMSAKWRHV